MTPAKADTPKTTTQSGATFLWHNGQLKPQHEPVLTAADRLARGDGVFDTMLAIDGKPVHAAAHFGRLKRHAAILGIDLHADLEQSASALLHKNHHTQGRHALTTLISRGAAARGLTIPAKAEIQIIMQSAPVTTSTTEIKAIISQTVRRNEGSPLARIKSVNYGDHILALAEAQKKGANEAIMLNNTGKVTCTTIGNIFALINGQLLTPPQQDGVMDGIVRGILLRDHGAKERSLTPDDLLSAQGLYSSNSIAGLRPIHMLDGKALPLADLPINPDFYISQ